MSDPIKDLLCSYLDIPGMLAAILVSDQGLMVNCALAHQVETETISALVVDTITSAQRFGRECGVGRLDTLAVDFESMSLLLAPFEQDVMLALVALPGTFAPHSVGSQV